MFTYIVISLQKAFAVFPDGIQVGWEEDLNKA